MIVVMLQALSTTDETYKENYMVLVDDHTGKQWVRTKLAEQITTEQAILAIGQRIDELEEKCMPRK